MAFRFNPTERIADGFQRIVAEQIARAQEILRNASEESVAVHEARKSIKRLRALLRLVRPSIGEKTFKSENAFLRDIGLSLSGARDRFVLTETLKKLGAEAQIEPRSLIADVCACIAGGSEASDPEQPRLAIKQADALLDAAKARLEALKFAGSQFDVVGAGLEQSYRRARLAFAEAYRSDDDEAFHEWRKGAQTHWRQMLLLAPAWPGYLGARAAEARALSQLLGDDHDLAVVVAFLQSEATTGVDEEGRACIAAKARDAQRALRAEAYARGQRLFAAGPKRLRRAVGEFWNAAAALKALEDDRAAELSGNGGNGGKARKRVTNVGRKVRKPAE